MRIFTASQQIYLWLTAVFITCLVVANLMGSMVFSIPLPFELPWVGSAAILSAGIIPFPVTFLLTDLVNEFYGKEGARKITLIGFGMSVLVFLLLTVGESLPVIANSPIPKQAFLAISHQYTQMFVASLMAYLVGQFLDIYVFQVFKSITGSRLIWLRATGSTIISQLFDSFIVTFIGLSGGALTLAELFHIGACNYLWKFVIAVGITPILYLGHGLLRRFMIPATADVIENPEALEH